MIMKHRVATILSFVLTSSVLGTAPQDYAETQRLASVIDHIKHLYIKEIPMNELMGHAIKGLLSELDPHSTYLDPDALKELSSNTTGELTGIGVEITEERGRLKVVTPLDDSPAKKAGIHSGDYILKVNDTLVENSKLYDAINLIRGPVGSTLKLTVLNSQSHEPITLDIKREKINIASVKSKTIFNNIGYIRISSFTETTAKDVKKAIASFKKQDTTIKGIVLDVRNNPGGLLNAAIQTADLFLDSKKLGPNKKIVYTKGRFSEDDVIGYASPVDYTNEKPLAVLINEGTASAAEILAIALQDHNRSILVGRQSFGKGSVQSIFNIDDSSAIKLTTALYYSPNGQSIQEMGVKPDVYVPFDELTGSILNDRINISEQSLNNHLVNTDKKTIKNAVKSQLNELAKSDFPLYQSVILLEGLEAFQS